MSDENPAVSTSAATAAAHSADAAHSAANTAASEAVAAAAAAESAAANVEQVAAAVENAGDHIAEVAAGVTEAAIESAVTQIEADLENENTWLNGEVALIKRDLETIKAKVESLTPIQLTEVLSRLETMQSQLSTLLPSQRVPTNPPSEEGAGHSEAPNPPAVPKRPKRQRI